MGALDWTYLVGGHGNVGSTKDIDFYNVFLDDLEAAVAEALASTPLGTGVDMATLNNHAELMAAWMGAIAKKATDELRPTYGKLYGFEVSTRANAEKVTLSIILLPLGKKPGKLD